MKINNNNINSIEEKLFLLNNSLTNFQNYMYTELIRFNENFDRIVSRLDAVSIKLDENTSEIRTTNSHVDRMMEIIASHDTSIGMLEGRMTNFEKGQ